MEIKQLIDDYIHWLKKEITFEKIGEYYEITTPFLNSANDFIQIYARIDKDTIFFTYDKYPYGKPQTDEVARGSGNREYGCRRLREKLPNFSGVSFLEPGIPVIE